jgi:hypothetical protein
MVETSKSASRKDCVFQNGLSKRCSIGRQIRISRRRTIEIKYWHQVIVVKEAPELVSNTNSYCCVSCRSTRAPLWCSRAILPVASDASLAGDTLSSRHVSSYDVTRAVGMWEAISHWIVWRRFTLLSHCLSHMISRGALVGSRASTPLRFLLSHTFRETWRKCRAFFRRYQLFPEMGEMLIEKVRQRTFLYDTKSPDYRDQHMRDNAWERIGKELKIKRNFYVSSRDVRIVCPRL